MSRLAQVVDPDAPLELLAEGFVFTEGPAWNPIERALVFSDIPGDARYRWSEERGCELIAAPTLKGNGMAYEADGSLLVCEQVSSQLVRFTPDGHRDVVAFHHGGRYLNSPNDVVVSAKDGAIYFTDPNYGRWPGAFGWERTCDLDFEGVFRVPPGGGDAELVVEPGEFEQPNGLCFSPDESLMYINDTPRAHIKVFDVAADGTLSNGRMFFENIGSGVIEEGIPDGMKIDERGNVWVTGPRGVWVISPEGEHLGVVEVPENTGNMTWGDEDWKSLYIPSSTSLYRIRTKVGPARLPYHP